MIGAPPASPDLQHRPRGLTVRQADLAVGAAFVVVGLLTIYGSLGLSYAVRAGPGPGFLPRWLGIGLVLTGLGLLGSRLRTKNDEALPLPGRWGFVRVGLALVLMAALVASIELLGFLVATAGMVFCLLVFLEREPPLRAVVLSVILSLGFYLLFHTWLGQKLPPGLVGF